MPSNLNYSVGLRNAQLDQITAAVDAGGAGGVLRIYNGSQPANVGTAITSQTVLAELTCSYPFAPAASAGVLTASAIASDVANASGAAAWFRISTSAGAAVIDGTVGTSDADLILDNVNLVAGGTVEVESLAIGAGNA